MESPVLLERERELLRLEELLEAAAGGSGRMVLIEGEAGIGKTSLLRAAAERAEAAGVLVLHARGGVLERGFPHGVVRQLYEPVVRAASGERRRRLFRGAAALAEQVVGSRELLADGRDAADAAFAVNHGLYWLTVELSDEVPLLLAVDDVHWADQATLLFLEHLGRRVDELPVLVAGALRPAEPGAPHELLDALRAVPAAEGLHPALLSEQAAQAVIEQTTARVPAAEFVRAGHDATGGNPFLLEELARALAADGGEPDAEAAGRVRQLGPHSIARSVLGRLATVWGDAVELARAVAVLDTDAELRHAARIAALDWATAIAAADALTSAQVLAPGRPLRFVHPIIRQAVYDDLPEGRRAADHARAARVLHEEGPDPDRAAVHLLATEPTGDAWVVERLRAAAARAVGRGDARAAAALLRRAIEEPPPRAERPRTLFELGCAARSAGEADAIALLTEALETAADAGLRADVAEELGAVLAFGGDFDRGLEILERTARAVLDEDREASLRLEAALDWLSLFSDSLITRAAQRIDRLLPELTGATPSERVLLAAAAYHRNVAMSVPAAEIIELAERAAADHLIIEEQSPSAAYYGGALDGLLWNEQHARGRELLEAAVQKARRTGSRTAWMMASVWQTRLAELEGDLRANEQLARETLAFRELGTMPRLWVAGTLCFSLLHQGRPAEAYALLQDLGLADCDVPRFGGTGWCFLLARTHVRAAVGRVASALADAYEVTERTTACGRSTMNSGFMYSSAVALHVAGDDDAACREARRELGLAQLVGTDSAVGNATLALALAEGGRAPLERFEEAATRLARTPRRLEAARALVEYGAALRRANRRREARDPLARGMDLAHRCGARPLVERANDELLACGARPRRLLVSGLDALTASERRVARMAADGLSNTDIAQALFVTRKTVETHLGHVYVKLGIPGREALPGALSERPGGGTR